MKTILLLWLALIAIAGAEKLDFSAKNQDVHASAEATTVSADYEFTNRSGKAVTIRRYEALCRACMSATVKGGKLHYAPGESGVIRVTFNMGNFVGDVNKSVVVFLDNDPDDKPSVVLTARVHIPVLVSAEPKTVKWDLGGKPETKSVRITMNHSTPIKVTQVTSSSEAFTRELKTITEGKEYELLITPAAVNAKALCIIRIDTDCDIAKHKTQQVFGVIQDQQGVTASR